MEWAKSLARKTRWEEEVLLLREEMRRVLRSLAGEASEWSRRAETREDISPEMNSGVRAYALSQKSHCDALSTQFQNLWSVPLKIRQEYELNDTFVANTEEGPLGMEGDEGGSGEGDGGNGGTERSARGEGAEGGSGEGEGGNGGTERSDRGEEALRQEGVEQ